MKNYTLRELCETCGVTRRAVQGYEDHGLISPCGKTERCYLLYDSSAVEKAIKIKSLQNYGFTVKEIKLYLSSDNFTKKSMLKQKLEKLKRNKAQMISYIKEIEILINQKEI